MLLSLYVNPRSTDPVMDLEVMDETIEQVLEADEVGFAALMLTEHHFSGVNAYQDPFMLGTYLAPQLKNRAYINIGTLCVPYHHPLRIVEFCNLLDVLTKGRCMIGLGSGGVTALEYDAWGVDAARKRDMLEQKITVALKAWERGPNDPPLDVSTDWDTGVLSGRLMPPSHRYPRPLLARVSTRPEVLQEAGRLGWPVMFGLSPTPEQLATYRDALEHAGHGPEVLAECERWLCHTKYMWLAETDEEAWEQIGPTLDDIIEKSGWVVPTQPAGSKTALGFRSYRTKEEFLHSTAIVGSPQTVYERILESNAEYGLDHVRLWFNYWTLSEDLPAVRRSWRLFLDEVLPRLELDRMPDPTSTTREALAGARYAVAMEGMGAELGADQALPVREP